ncbi:MAG TPA: class I SAM-dependent methyltransferase [Candidatus Sabulitectum sp.]|nr:class I SAM-dependent methyltransferase [Candidatus Sabulitectum sp.]HPJ29270.1 class I SAM-dependent methyltransferase [Candidatus Sabulitectum sp.]HPR22501.1 class I SAM-dependent methyltransferase [Candidatus Sabulitectum sp.]HRW77520.1 class I SAM-dependent methyltransferase [Candidatus Sabulitectum sp.]
MKTKTSERGHWDRFWERERDLSEIYDNDDRIRIETASRLSLEGKLTLEVGAATARDSVSLGEEGAVPVALDYSHPALKLAAEAAARQEAALLLVCGDANALPFRDDSFDLVFHQGVLEHFRNPDGITDECVRVLKPGGNLLVDVPQTFHPYTALKKVLIAMNAWFAGWETQYTAAGLNRYLRSRGLVPWSVYARYFSPSLGYRIFREVLMKLGVKLPLRPVLIPPVHRLRGKVRSRVEKSRLGPLTGVVIGVFAGKELPDEDPRP